MRVDQDAMKLQYTDVHTHLGQYVVPEAPLEQTHLLKVLHALDVVLEKENDHGQGRGLAAAERMLCNLLPARVVVGTPEKQLEQKLDEEQHTAQQGIVEPLLV